MERKILSDGVAYLRSLAQLCGQNADGAERLTRVSSQAQRPDDHRNGASIR
jgi:hypothetical protein